MPRLLLPPLGLLSDGTVIVNVREFFGDPVPDLLALVPRVRGRIFLGVPASSAEARLALRRLQEGHREAAAYLVGARQRTLFRS